MNSSTDTTLTTIYVGDIPPNIDAEGLRSIFEQYGHIENLTVKPSQKQGSIYALITFDKHDDAETAIRELNYSKVEGRPIRVAWRRLNSDAYDIQANLVISNLPADVEEQSLHQLIEQFGPIISCRILRNREGVSNGRGYIQFANAADAARALEELKGAQIGENQIFIEKYLPKNQRQDVPTPLPQNVIAVEGPAEMLSEERLRAAFQSYGDIIEITHINDLGIIFFAKNDSAYAAQKGFSQPGISIRSSVRKEITLKVLGMIESRTIFVSDLIEPNEGNLREHLSRCGQIVSFELHSQQSIASVQYRTAQERDTAVSELDHTTFPGQRIPIRVLPFFDTRLDHDECGLIVFNELPITTRYLDFRHELAQFGQLLAVALVPTRTGQALGYALFKNLEDALKAKEGAQKPNVFLFPKRANSVGDLLQLFGHTKGGRCLAVYDPKMSSSDAYDILAPLGPLAAVDSVGGVVLAYFDDMAGALAGFERMLQDGKAADVYTPALPKWFATLMNTTQIPPEMEQRFTYVKGLGIDMSNAQIRELFETVAPVEAAFMSFNPENGAARGGANVLFQSAQGAVAAIQNPPWYEQELIVAWYMNAKNRTMATPPVQQMPQQGRGVPRPREMIKNYITSNAPKDKAKELIEKVKMTLSNDEVSLLAASPERIEHWMQEQLKVL